MFTTREEKLIRRFLENHGESLYRYLPEEERISKLRSDLEKANLVPYAIRLAKRGESYVSNNSRFEVWKVWTDHRECHGPRLIVRNRAEKKPVVAPKAKSVKPSAPFEKRFYNESSITYETAPGEGFKVFFSREEREVVLIHKTGDDAKTYSAKAHPDDQYDEQFGFELAAARFWGVSQGLETIRDFIPFRAYVWGAKGWGVLDLTKCEHGGGRWPHYVNTLLAASKDPSFRQRVVAVKPAVESPLDILKRYKETPRGKDDKKTAEKLEKHLLAQGYVPVAVRDPQEGDKFWWSCYCQSVLGPIQSPWEDDAILIVAPIPAATNPDEKPLSFIRQELSEEGLDVTLAEGFLKQYREWGFEPEDYRKATEGEFTDTVFEGDPAIPHEIKHHSGVKLLIFRKRG